MTLFLALLYLFVSTDLYVLWETIVVKVITFVFALAVMRVRLFFALAFCRCDGWCLSQSQRVSWNGCRRRCIWISRILHFIQSTKNIIVEHVHLFRSSCSHNGRSEKAHKQIRFHVDTVIATSENTCLKKHLCTE